MSTSAMDSNLQTLTSKLFSHDLNQKIVRNISKDLENLQPSDQHQLVEKIDHHVRTLLVNNPMKALTTATLMADGSDVLKKGLFECVEEILKVCCTKIESFHMTETRKQSDFHIAAKAVYGIVQYVLPTNTEIFKSSALQLQLKRVYLALLRSLVSDRLPSDCSLIVSTSLCITSAIICKGDEEVKFMNLVNTVKQLEMQKQDIEEGELTNLDVIAKNVQEFYTEISPSFPIVLLLHGLFNSNPSWLYSSRFSGNENDVLRPRPFLEYIHPLIMRGCKTATNYVFQAFQVLHMWLTCVRKYGRMLMDEFCDKEVKAGCSFKYHHPASWSLFQIQADDSDTVFHLLNSNWENPAKGVSDIVYTSMLELLELHEDGKAGQAKILAASMLEALVSSAAWSSKSTYPPLALALSFIGAKEALQRHPLLPAGLLESLKVNHLASAGTNVYKIVLSHLSHEDWHHYFLTIVCDGLHSRDRLIQQNILTLWLPPTLRQYGNIYQELIAMCQECTSGWLARIAILRVARSLGILDLKESYDMEIENNSSERMEVPSVMEYIEASLSYIDESVRGEAVAFLCCTQKGSLPVSLKESELLKEFFRWNMNIDSAPFRQGIIKCYKTLIIRLRDTCASELKKKGYKYRDTKSSPLESKLLQKLPVLKVNYELLVWFIHFYHEQLAPDGNYQRRILSLQLYKETLLAFYETTETGIYTMNDRCANVCGFINSVSAVSNVRNKIVDLSLPWTQEMLLSSIMDEMNDVREEAEFTLKILESSKNPLNYSNAQVWLMRGFSMCDSPKASYAESGATLVKVVTSACHAGNHDITTMLTMKESQSLLTFLYYRVKEQFEAAKVNLLEASHKAPIHGSLMALGYCLCRETSTTRLTQDEIQEYMSNLTDLMVEMTEFLLSQLAYASPNGSAFAPSFAEMGESIEMIIKECEGQLTQQDKASEKENSLHEDVGEDAVEEVEDIAFQNNAISGNHQLILACCWQTMKACCNVTSMSITHWLGYLEESIVEKLLQGVIVRILTGTRHKGAMEAARASYNQLCSALLNSRSNIGHLVYKQVNEVLDQLESGAHTSVTRRGAGIAMMMQAACGAAPRTNVALINTTISRLIHISQLEYEEQNTLDASPVLALHILQSLVLHAPLAHHLVHHLPTITMTCLHAFTNHSWALRNAALQLYGAVVPRMVGQKKVRDDSSTLNSLTVPEFLSRHPSLACSLLHMLLEKAPEARSRKMVSNSQNNEGEIFKREENLESMSIKVSSSLVPVLSLLARLSPGTGLQQSTELRGMLHQYCCETTRLLGSPIHTVRRLASLAIVNLTPLEEILQLVHTQIALIQEHSKTSNNNVHGSLLTLMNILTSYPNITNNSQVKKDVITTLGALVKSNNSCYINIVIAMRTCQLFGIDVDMEQSLGTCHTHPGAPEYVKLRAKIDMKQKTESEKEKYMMSLILENQDIEEVWFEYIKEHVELQKTSPWLKEIEKLLWGKLEQNFSRQCSQILRTLSLILREQGSIAHLPADRILRNIINLLKGHHGVKVAAETLVIASYILKRISCNQWPSEDIKRDLLSSFSALISTYADPTSTEDYRMAASEALRVSLRILLFGNLKMEPICYEQLLCACMELLQDEDCIIRDSACHIVESLTENANRNMVYSEGKFEVMPKNLHILHPNLALKKFLEILLSWSASSRQWHVLKIIWKICSNQQIYCDKSGKSEEGVTQPKSYLFQSHTMNLYKEPKHLSIISSELLLKTITENKGQIDQDNCSWIRDECEHLNKQGHFLQGQMSTDGVLVIKKELLVALSTYIVAYNTLSQIGNILKINLNLSYPISWNSSKFCIVDYK